MRPGGAMVEGRHADRAARERRLLQELRVVPADAAGRAPAKAQLKHDTPRPRGRFGHVLHARPALLLARVQRVVRRPEALAPFAEPVEPGGDTAPGTRDFP